MGSLFTSANSYVEVDEALVYFPEGQEIQALLGPSREEGVTSVLIPIHMDPKEAGPLRKRNGLRTDTQEGRSE